MVDFYVECEKRKIGHKYVNVILKREFKSHMVREIMDGGILWFVMDCGILWFVMDHRTQWFVSDSFTIMTRVEKLAYIVVKT